MILTLVSIIADMLAFCVLLYEVSTIKDDLGEMFMLALLVVFFSMDLFLVLSIPLYLNRLPPDIQRDIKDWFETTSCGKACHCLTCCCCQIDADDMQLEYDKMEEEEAAGTEEAPSNDLVCSPCDSQYVVKPASIVVQSDDLERKDSSVGVGVSQRL